MSLKPGRELDILVAEKIFGCKLSTRDPTFLYEGCDCPGHPHSYRHSDGQCTFLPLKNYSTDLSHVWEIVEKFLGKGKYLDLHYCGSMWHASFEDNALPTGFSKDSAAMAICEAALIHEVTRPKSQDEKRFIKLGWEILQYKFNYYVLDAPTLEDHEYDQLEREYDALAKLLGVEPTAADMVGFKQTRPACALVADKLQARNPPPKDLT